MRDTLVQQVTDLLNTKLAGELNKLVAEQKGYSNVWNHMDLDWSIPAAPQVDSDDLRFGIKGLLFPESEGEVPPPVTAPIMPYNSGSGTQKLQAFVSNYVFDSFAYSFLRTNDINLWSNYTNMPSDFPLTLTTTGLNKFFPGLANNYGADLPVNIEYTLDEVRNFTVKE